MAIVSEIRLRCGLQGWVLMEMCTWPSILVVTQELGVGYRGFLQSVRFFVR